MTRGVKFRLGLLLGTTKRFLKYNVPSSATVKHDGFPPAIYFLIFSTSESHVCIHLMVLSRSSSTTRLFTCPYGTISRFNLRSSSYRSGCSIWTSSSEQYALRLKASATTLALPGV